MRRRILTLRLDEVVILEESSPLEKSDHSADGHHGDEEGDSERGKGEHDGC